MVRRMARAIEGPPARLRPAPPLKRKKRADAPEEPEEGACVVTLFPLGGAKPDEEEPAGGLSWLTRTMFILISRTMGSTFIEWRAMRWSRGMRSRVGCPAGTG